MAVVDSAIVFLVSLGIGALGIHLGAILIQGESNYVNAIITALIGAIIWSLVGSSIGVIPLLGPILTLLAWLAVINWRYPGGWLSASAIALTAWIAVFVILYILATLQIGSFGAIGVPVST